MFSILLSSLCLGGLYAQTVAVSSHLEDQFYQGPCYIFALTAALESKAIENPVNGLNDVNFDEWYLYSESVLTYDGQSMPVWSGHMMIPPILRFVKDHGILAGKQPAFTSQSVPNKGRNGDNNELPGAAEFQDCNFSAAQWGGYQYYDISNGPFLGTRCEDDDQVEFVVTTRSSSDVTYFVESAPGSSDLFIRDNSPTAAKIGNLLFQDIGVVAFFQNWEGSGREHAIFIYSKQGNTYSYKDSWPGAPGLKQKTLNLSNCVSIYHIPGEVYTTSPPSPSCTYDIQGNNSVSGVTTYSISGGFNAQWNLTGNLVFDGASTGNSVNVATTSCSGTSNGTISVTYTSGGTSCTKNKTVTVNGTASAKPSAIQINGPAGLHTACPGSVIQLQAIDSNPSYPITTYNWSISGANILNGQGTPTVNIQIWNGSSIYQSYKVRAKKASCSYSGWRTLTGYVTAQGCNNGGGIGIFGPNLLITKREIDGSRYFQQNLNTETIVVEVYSLSGKNIFTRKLSRNAMNASIPVSSDNGVWVVNVIDEQTHKVERFKMRRIQD